MNAISNRERLTDLLADEAAAALGPGADRELAELLAQAPRLQGDELMRTASLVQLACLRRDSRGTQRLPANLRARIAEQGPAFRPSAPDQVRPHAPVPPVTTLHPAGLPAKPRPEEATAARVPRRYSMNYMGWALAAVLALAFVVVRTGAPVPATTSPATARASLLTEADDVIVLPWTAPVAGYENVKGDVVWSESRQAGYLRLAGMPVNDPADRQYQLWIVAPERDSRHPVDGGVFDVPTTGEVVIPIQAKLRVTDPRAFAITAEQPGGVVVSAGPLLLVAASG